MFISGGKSAKLAKLKMVRRLAFVSDSLSSYLFLKGNSSVTENQFRPRTKRQSRISTIMTLRVRVHVHVHVHVQYPVIIKNIGKKVELLLGYTYSKCAREAHMGSMNPVVGLLTT